MAFTAEHFLSIIKPAVIKDMQKTKILASLTAAQALIESNKGNSGLTQKANNLFGIKADKRWTGPFVEMNTKENYNGNLVTVKAKFRSYDPGKNQSMTIPISYSPTKDILILLGS